MNKLSIAVAGLLLSASVSAYEGPQTCVDRVVGTRIDNLYLHKQECYPTHHYDYCRGGTKCIRGQAKRQAHTEKWIARDIRDAGVRDAILARCIAKVNARGGMRRVDHCARQESAKARR